MNSSKQIGALFSFAALTALAYVPTSATQAMYNGYWSTSNGFQSLAQLHNNAATASLTVQPVLYSPSGQAMNLNPVTMAPLGNATIDIGSALAAQGWSQVTTGTSIFRYQGSPGQLEVEIYQGNPGKSISFTIPSTDKPFASPTQDAVFLLPSPNAEIWVSLQNLSNQTIHVVPSVTLAGSTTPMSSVTLAPYGSSVVWIWSPPLSPVTWQKNAVGGITLSQDGPPGALNSGAWIEDDGIGYSTTLTLVNPQTPGQTLIGTQILVGNAGLPLGLPQNFVIQSQLVLRNMSSQPADVQGTLMFSDNSGGTFLAPLPALHLAALEVIAVDLGQVKSQAGAPPQLVCASLSLQYSGASGAVMGRVFGTSTDGSYGLYWALQPSAGNVYYESFWSTQDNWTPIFTVGNFGTSNDQIAVLLTSNQGTYALPLIDLKPLESRTVNIRELLGAAQPFPAGVNYGGFKVSGSSQQSRIMAKEHLIDTVAELATPFYGSYQYIVNAFFDENSTDLDDDGDTCCQVGVSTNATVYIGALLSGEPDDYSNGYFPYDSEYGSNDTSIATLSFSGNTGTISGGSSAGTVAIYATIYGVYDSSGDEGPIGTESTQASIDPVVSLVVNGGQPVSPSSISQQNGTTKFYVDGQAGGGFTGTMPVSITVSAPTNGNSIALSQGTSAQTFSFNLSAGGSSNGTCVQPTTNCFVIETSSGNSNTGSLTYTVTLNPSALYTVGNGTSPKQVTITVQ